MDENINTHNTHDLKVTVYYPFHPLYGKTICVVRKSRTKDGFVTVKDPQGKDIKIPVWMISQEAQYYTLSSEATIRFSSLSMLSNFLKIFFKDK